MKRVMIIGCSGAGKSTLATRLQPLLDLPLVHLDQAYWKPNWVESEKKLWTKKMEQLVQREQWIMDGNYGSTMHLRLAHADAVIYLDFPTYICLARIFNRTWKYHGRSRPDMPKGCPERYNLEFFHYVLTFNRTRRPKLLQVLNQAVKDRNLKVYRLRSNQQVESFIQNIKMQQV